MSLTTGGAIRCTGSLLGTGRHILTAAHCVTNAAGVQDASAATITFPSVAGGDTYSASAFHIHPGWDGSLARGNDIAIVELSAEADASVERYGVYTDNDEVGQVGDKFGYGLSGTGLLGTFLSSGTKRTGQNLYDTTADLMLSALGFVANVDFDPGTVLQYDFDNGLTANDAFGFFFGLNDLGLGVDEVLAGSGDSGGPTFIDGLIAGVTSYGISLQFSNGATSDITAGLDSSFGEFGGDTRVSVYQDWILGITGVLDDGSALSDEIDSNPSPIPGPAPWVLMLLCIRGLFLSRKRLQTPAGLRHVIATT